MICQEQRNSRSMGSTIVRWNRSCNGRCMTRQGILRMKGWCWCCSIGSIWSWSIIRNRTSHPSAAGFNHLFDYSNLHQKVQLYWLAKILATLTFDKKGNLCSTSTKNLNNTLHTTLARNGNWYLWCCISSFIFRVDLSTSIVDDLSNLALDF